MKMDKPILTSDLSFARDICKEAALYIDPLDKHDISNKMIDLAGNEFLRDKLIYEGRKRLVFFPDAKERAQMYLEICKRISKS